jgi:ubiquinone/menaquinone biosynthesis C-methylase UbiE
MSTNHRDPAEIVFVDGNGPRVQGPNAVSGAVPLLTRPGRPKRFFDRIAPWYDRINARIYDPAWRAAILASVHGRVLDVGVGTGFTTGSLDRAVGLDLSREMLRRARYRGHLVQGDFRQPPFRPHAFDGIVFAGSFYYLGDPSSALRTAEALLRPGGAIVILSPATPLLAAVVPIYSRREYEELFRGAGLVLDDYRRLGWAACLLRGHRGGQ